MKVGLVSDSHGNLEYLKEVAEKLINEKVDLIIHLGDNYDDAKILDEFNAKVIKVPGVFSNYYQDPKIANRRIENFNGWRILLTHTPTTHENDLPTDPQPEELVRRKAVDVILYGHTHIPNVKEMDKILYINPGHLKLEDKKGYKASFAVIDFNEKEIKAKIVDLGGKEIASMSFSRQGS